MNTVSIPRDASPSSKFRDQLGKTIAMMRGKGGCIELYSLTEWNAVYEKFEKNR